MNTQELLLNALDERGKTYNKKLKRCREDFSTDAIHDLRTSIRRLLAILDVTAFITPSSRIEKLSGSLDDQLDGFSKLRDMQVMLEKMNDNADELPSLEPFQKYLKKREKRRQRADEKHIQNIKPGSIKNRLQKIQKDVEDLSEADLHGKMSQAGDEVYLTVIQRYSEVDPSKLVTIHHLRVAFKKFHYLVEAIYPCLPNFPESMLQRLRDYQTKMGDIHDLQVFLETLAEFAEKDESYNPRPVRAVYEKILDEALADYLQNKNEVLTFWRATPLQAFPWEAGQTKKEE